MDPAAFHAATLISPVDSNLSYSYSPNTISPQALERPDGHPEGRKAQPKKRKSWGQVLPEPKTNLPPRKRAKTEDEKEQRRIERVKRNRLAAHNSRERKRAEVDQLTTEKQCLEAQLQSMQARMNEMHAQLLRYQKLYPQVPIPKATSMSPPMKDELDFEGDSAYQSSSTTSTIDPKEASFSSPAPSDMSSVQSSPQTVHSDAHAPAIKADNVVRPAVSVGIESVVNNASAHFHHQHQQQSVDDFDALIVANATSCDSGLAAALAHDSAPHDYLHDAPFDDLLDLSSLEPANSGHGRDNLGMAQQAPLHSHFEELFPGMESITPLSSLEKPGASFPFFADAGFGATTRDEPGLA
ncbi:MAG: transcription factor that binds to CRE motif [Bathelium mastoideum]|nr:MAG: transcription factor that binds to CRE motif [Bathelium mastoideum]